MAITFVEGLAGVGDGKSYLLVNKYLRDFLTLTRKHVYTTCPCDGEQKEFLLADCFPRGQHHRRDEAESRLHFLYPGEQEWYQEFYERPMLKSEVELAQTAVQLGHAPPFEIAAKEGEISWVRVPWPTNAEMDRQYKEDGVRYRRVAGGKACRVGQFWRFVPAGAVVIIDEIADVFGSDEMSGDKSRRMQFGQFLRQHRHYKFDLIFCAQNANDIDVKARRLFERQIFCRNLKKTPFINHWSCRGLRWPVQVFEVREFLSIHTLNKSGEQILRMVPVDSYRVWPRTRGFKNYRSFSASSMLPGKGLARDEERSGDLDRPWDRIKNVFNGLWRVLAVGGFMIMAGVCGLSFIYTMAGADSGKVGKFLYGKHVQSKTNHHETNNILPTVSVVVPSGTNSPATNAPVVPPKPLALVFVAPDCFMLSDNRVFRCGDQWPGGGSVRWWDQRGLWIVPGKYQLWQSVLLSCGQSPGKSGGPVHQ